MKRAVDDGWLTVLPTLNLRPLKWSAKRRGLLPADHIKLLCATAVKDKTFKNGREFADYVKLMAACGARRNETLRLKWSDINWAVSYTHLDVYKRQPIWFVVHDWR